MPDNDVTMKLGPPADRTCPPSGLEPPPPGQGMEDGETRRTPKQIGKYQVIKPLGQGGMGRVYLCRHPNLDVEVVVKIIHGRFAADPEYRSRFLSEGCLAAKLRVASVAQVYDAGEDGDMLYIAQEYVSGGNALQAMSASPGGTLAADRALDIVIGVCKALCAAHELGIVHRDVKPENILLTPEGDPKLADFGLAARHSHRAAGQAPGDEAGHLTGEFTGMGSPHYAAPEQATDARSVDIRADIYSLGATFYHLVTGKTPFTGRTAFELFMRHARELPVDPCKANPAVGRQIGRVIRKMMAKDPADRHQTPRELLAELEDARSSGVTAWAPLWVAAAALVVLAVGLVAIVVRQAPNEAELKEVQLCLAAGRHEAALRQVAPLLTRRHPRPEALYAAGLSQLGMGDLAGLAATRERLKACRDGEEWAVHLQVAEAIQAGRTEDALGLITAWETKARHALPFLMDKAMLLLQENHLPEARDALRLGLLGEPFLGYQRYLARDAWARLFADEDRLPEAEAAYAEGLKGRTDTALASPAFFTNYAATLMSLGKKEKAAEMAGLALRVEPQDVVAHYLQAQASEAAASEAREQAQYVTTLISDIDRLAREKTSARDRWSTAPIVLTFIPLRNNAPRAARLLEEAALADLLATAVRETGPFPVVDRQCLGEVLREHQISLSELGSSTGVLKLGQVLPASVLVRGSLRTQGTVHELTLETIDVQTTEQIDISRGTLRAGASPTEALEELAGRLVGRLREWRSPQGRVVAREGTVAEISNGLCHGLNKGDSVRIYTGDGSLSARLLRRATPVCTGVVTEADRFTAAVQLGEGADKVARDMLTLRVADGEGRE